MEREEETVKEARYLIVVDMQKDFIDGSLGTPEAVAIVPEVIRRIRRARDEGWTVIATQDTHGENYLDTAEGAKLPVVHCVKGTEGWRIPPEIADALGDSAVVEKPTFGSVDLPRRIAPAEELTIELIGLCTDICVVSNALLLKAHFPEARMAVNSACCAGVTPEKHRAALETMASCQIDIL